MYPIFFKLQSISMDHDQESGLKDVGVLAAPLPLAVSSSTSFEK
jgi:hypothetical protein